MKKLFCLILSVMMILSLTACASSDEGKTPTGFAETYKVAIVQQLDHSSLDEIRVAIEEQMKMAEEYGMVMSDDSVKAAADFCDAQTTLQGAMTGFKKNDIYRELI